MFVVILIIAIVLIVICSNIAKKNKIQERAQIKEKMLNDIFICENSFSIVESIKDLKNASVKILRTGGVFYLIFNGGSVYYETRWFEGAGENRQLKKNTQCLLDRLDEGKNPLSEIEDEAFAEIIKDALDKVPWMSVSINGRELKISKAFEAVIPEA